MWNALAPLIFVQKQMERSRSKLTIYVTSGAIIVFLLKLKNSGGIYVISALSHSSIPFQICLISQKIQIEDSFHFITTASSSHTSIYLVAFSSVLRRKSEVERETGRALSSRAKPPPLIHRSNSLALANRLSRNYIALQISNSFLFLLQLGKLFLLLLPQIYQTSLSLQRSREVKKVIVRE